ncbi:hypothetical protein Aduo_015037 [Ancylostoma duodenale]
MDNKWLLWCQNSDAAAYVRDNVAYYLFRGPRSSTIPPMAPVKRRQCQLCGKRVREIENRWAFKRRPQSAVFISALLASYNGNSELLEGLYEKSIHKRMRFCHQHFIDAAQFMGAEMMLAGFKFPQPDDILFERTLATVGVRDIPSSLLQQLNVYVRQFDENLTLNAKDVAMFMRDAIKNYYTASGWMRGSMKKREKEKKKKGRRKVVEETVDDEEDFTQTDCEESCAQEESMKMEEEPFFEPCQVKIDAERDQWDTESSQGVPLSALLSPSDVKGEAQFSSGANDYSDKALDDAVGLPEADPSLLNGFFLVQGIMLMQLFMVCQQCGTRLSPGKVRLTAEGTSPVVLYYCPCCSIDKGDIKRWEGQRRSTALTRGSPFLGNILTAISAVVTGTRFGELHRWAKQMRLSFISISFFYKWFLHCKPSIEKVYVSHQQKVFDVIRRKYAGKGLHLSAASWFDSRGSNGLIANVAVADLETKLLLHTEVLHRYGTNNSRSKMAVEGLRRLLQWLSSEKWRISSITTDRNRSFPTLLNDLEKELGTFKHFWDGRCLAEWFSNRFKKEAKYRDCYPLSKWCKRLKVHLMNSIELGGGSKTPHMFNSCLKHVRDLHKWRKDNETCEITRCCHPPLRGPLSDALKKGSPAFEKLRRIVLNKDLQEDLKKANLRAGYTIFKTKNALDKLYRRKKIIYPFFAYKLYAMLSTMHYNTLVLAETAGERKVERCSGVQNKFCSRSRRVLETLVEPLWRDQIVEAVLEEHFANCHVTLNEVNYDKTEIREFGAAQSHFVGKDFKDSLESFYELGD